MLEEDDEGNIAHLCQPMVAVLICFELERGIYGLGRLTLTHTRRLTGDRVLYRW